MYIIYIYIYISSRSDTVAGAETVSSYGQFFPLRSLKRPKTATTKYRYIPEYATDVQQQQ